DRTIYNVVYRDGKGGVYFMKRFSVTGVSRDKEYDLTQGKAGSKVVYFTANPNGEAEVIRIQLKPALHLKKMEVCKDLSELAVKSRTARGNVLTKFEVKSITLKQKGHSTLGGRKVWFDPDVLRINYDGQGNYLGEFWDEDRILVITTTGDYYLTTFDLTAHFDQNILRIEKFNAEKVWTLALWNADLGYYYAKRFTFDATLKSQNMLGENKESRIVLLTDCEEPVFRLVFTDEAREAQEIAMAEFIDEKSPKAKGKRLSTLEISRIEDITPEPEPEAEEDSIGEETEGEERNAGDSALAGAEETKEEQPQTQAATGDTVISVEDVPMTITTHSQDSAREENENDSQLSLF
ncbi:MAG: hypothetical protein SPE88_02650, partial [Paludibacteraceae bacterium]|nr:hypothetical protein [Paludibacteraceae bacterium]